MFDQSHRQAGHRQFLTLKPGCWAEFHLVAVYPTTVQQGKAEFGGKPFETSPLDVHVYRAQPFDKDSGGPGVEVAFDDVLRWEPQAQNIAGLINLADDASARHGGDKTAITKYRLRVDVRQQYNKGSGRYYHVYEFRALDAAGKPLAERQLPPQPTVAQTAAGTAPVQPQAQQPQYQAPPQAQQQPAPKPGLSPLDELRESLAFVQDFPGLQAAWNAVSQRLAAAGVVPQAQQMVAPVKERLLVQQVAAHTDHAMLTADAPAILQRCGNDAALRQRIEGQIGAKLQLLATSFGYGANVEDIPL